MDKLTFLQGPYSFVLLALDGEVFCKEEATPEQVTALGLLDFSNDTDKSGITKKMR